MNREIEFRGIHSNKWLYGYLVKSVDDNKFYITVSSDQFYQVKEETIGQYTGLKDKNGKKIFEGDIIDIHQTVNGYNQFVIVYNDYQFTVEYYNEETKRRTHRFYEYDLDELFEINECEKEIEVIGNIYENLESKGE